MGLSVTLTQKGRASVSILTCADVDDSYLCLDADSSIGIMHNYIHTSNRLNWTKQAQEPFGWTQSQMVP